MSSCISTPQNTLFKSVYAWSNLLSAWKKAAKGKRRGNSCASFEHQLADNLLMLQQELITGSYQPSDYTHFYIHEPKRRLISAAPFRDRVVHHALCNVTEPIFENIFIPDSYANRVNKGTHKAVDRIQQFSKQCKYVLRLDIVQHFPSIDHAILFDTLSKQIDDVQTLQLIKRLIDSGENNNVEPEPYYLFPNDDLLSFCRPRGLPIGNLTSQFWSNCYLHPLDIFIKRELSCHYYLRYVDDFALFSDSKQQLWQWKESIRDKLAHLRLRFHEHSAQVLPVRCGVPWLGFVVYPDYRRVKKRKAVYASQKLNKRYSEWQAGEISFAEFDACVQGWVNYVRYADTWGLRKHVLKNFQL